jgi:Bacterial PH domain
METVYQMVPAGIRPLYLLLPIFLLLVAVMGFLSLTAYGSQRARFVLSDAGLDFRGDIYGGRVPWAALRVQEARIVDLSREAELRPRSRRWGTGLPGYAAGWFRLRNGERALLYVTAWSRVLYVPTSAGYVLVLSPQHPDEMLADLRHRADSAILPRGGPRSE